MTRAPEHPNAPPEKAARVVGALRAEVEAEVAKLRRSPSRLRRMRRLAVRPRVVRLALRQVEELDGC